MKTFRICAPFALALAVGCASVPKPAPALADPTGQRIVAAARKQIGTSYTQEYFSLKYPGGDPPANVGACSDVIVRALRPVGHDLQKLMHLDMKRNFSLYPRKWKLRRTDRNIDHRRVANQRVFFRRFAQVLGTGAGASTWKTWQPGDIVQWKLPGNLDHTGIVSNRKSTSGRPLVIHNLGGCVEEDALSAWPIVAHFRYPKR
jgi:uncharacterized protein YijF (DUF1287 family)